jgi:RNA polymerase sigma-70 factor (ECF subfamily)
MAPTSTSLLRRVGDSADAESWRAFDALYRPYILNWLRRFGLNAADAEDLAQETMLAVVRHVGDFHYDHRPGTFRKWLRTIAVNTARMYLRSRCGRGRQNAHFASYLDQIADPRSELAQAWEAEHDRYIAAAVMRQVEPQVQPGTWSVFRQVVCEGRKPSEVAEELHVSLNSVLLAKSRVLRKLRQAADGFLE